MEPTGAIVIVYRRGGRGIEYLVMHRGHAGPAYEGDWAWGPPSGAREPGETIDACARRELLEETGLRLDCTFACLDESGWPVYLAEAPADCAVCLSDEHDRFEWLPRAEAAGRTTPTVVRAQLLGAAARLEEPGG
ncbi:MAG TPA: NUDIX domain-containing protein [Chloroflexota bacterium]|jgi:dATP pyrophosphohydrolase|nr:NUDIX domain-containing protein [Chloroflexota bacterium]